MAAIDSLQTARQLLDRRENLAFWIYANGDLAEAYMIQVVISRRRNRIFQEIVTSLPPEQHLTNPVLDYTWGSYGAIYFKRNRLNEALEYVQRSIAIGRARPEKIVRSPATILSCWLASARLKGPGMTPLDLL